MSLWYEGKDFMEILEGEHGDKDAVIMNLHEDLLVLAEEVEKLKSSKHRLSTEYDALANAIECSRIDVSEVLGGNIL